MIIFYGAGKYAILFNSGYSYERRCCKEGNGLIRSTASKTSPNLGFEIGYQDGIVFHLIMWFWQLRHALCS